MPRNTKECYESFKEWDTKKLRNNKELKMIGVSEKIRESQSFKKIAIFLKQNSQSFWEN